MVSFLDLLCSAEAKIHSVWLARQAGVVCTFYLYALFTDTFLIGT